jgi:hypothetical protein
MLASALRGGVVGTLGGPGDLEEVIRGLSGSTNPNVLPTSKTVGETLPSTGLDKSYKPYESVGEFLPTSPAKAAPALAKAALPGALSAAFLPVHIDDLAAIKATELKMKGAGSKDIWNETQLSEAEIPLAAKGDPPVWLSEMAPTKNYLKPGREMSQEQKAQLLDTQMRLGNQNIILEADNPQLGTVKKFITETEVPKPTRNILTKDLMNHPAIDAVPDLGEIPVSIYQKGLSPRALTKYNQTDYRGLQLPAHHTGKTNRIVLTGRDLSHIDDQFGTPTNILEHEFQHSIQDMWGLPQGGSIWSGEPLDRLMAYKPRVLGELRASTASNKDVLSRQLRGIFSDPVKNYRNLAGERQARLAAERLHYTPKERHANRPILMDDEIDGKPLPLDNRYLRGMLTELDQNPGMSASDLTSYILRNFGHK